MAIQGEDIQVRFTLTDGVSAIPPSTLNAYSINVYYTDPLGVKQNISTYKSSNTGLYDIIVFNDATGKVDIIINRELTKTISKAKVYAEVYIQETASAEFILSKSVNGVGAIYLFDMETSSNSSAI